MKKFFLFALVAALPLMAQEAAPQQQPCNCGCNEGKPCECAPVCPDKKAAFQRMHRFTEEQKAAFRAKMLEKFDTNKDGQLDDSEKEAMKAEIMKHHQGKPGMHRPQGQPAAPCNCGCGEGKPCECKGHMQGRPHMGRPHKHHHHHGMKPAPQQPCNCGCNEGKPCECGGNCPDKKPCNCGCNEGKPCECGGNCPDKKA